jgi:hypothetical protein
MFMAKLRHDSKRGRAIPSLRPLCPILGFRTPPSFSNFMCKFSWAEPIKGRSLFSTGFWYTRFSSFLFFYGLYWLVFFVIFFKAIFCFFPFSFSIYYLYFRFLFVLFYFKISNISIFISFKFEQIWVWTNSNLN